jgi:hypothetical protein
MVHPEDVGALIAEGEKALRGSGFVRHEYRILDRAGNIRWFRDEAMLVRDPAGRPLAWHGVLVEIGQPSEAGRLPMVGIPDQRESPAPTRPHGG